MHSNEWFFLQVNRACWIISKLRFVHFLLVGCEYQCKWLPAKTRLQHDSTDSITYFHLLQNIKHRSETWNIQFCWTLHLSHTMLQYLSDKFSNSYLISVLISNELSHKSNCRCLLFSHATLHQPQVRISEQHRICLVQVTSNIRDVTYSKSNSFSEIRRYLKSDRVGFEIFVSVQLCNYFRK